MTDSPTPEKKRSGRSQRRLRNILINKDFQLRFAAVFVLNFLLGLVAIPFVLGDYFSETNITEMKIGNQTVISAVPDADMLYLKMVVFLALYNIVSVVFGVIISHRVAGPVVALRNHIKRLLAGEYGSRVHLRKNDEFKELAEDLNKLAANLEGEKD